jgi:lon-related putative ATP-dependent protease
MPIKPLKSQALKRRCDAAKLRFKTTAELKELPEVLGQGRAVAALKFGVGIQRDGFNLFALGPSALGKHSTVRQFLETAAAAKAAPDDWCYLYNFDNNHRPRALRLPSGTGVKLHRDVERLVEELQTAIASVFESDEYRTRRQAIDEEFQDRQSHAFEDLEKRANARGIALVRTPVGLALAPMKDGEVMAPDAFQALPESERSSLEAVIQEFQKKLQTTVRQIPHWDKERREKVREVNREVMDFAVGHLIETLRQSYKELPGVIAHLDAVQADVIGNVAAFVARPPAEGGAPPDPPSPMQAAGAGPNPAGGLARRYQVNVVVDNSGARGAPVVYEDNPALGNLVGRVEHLAQMGALITDFGLIQSGALHRANGGYLILDARKLLMQPHAYEALKRALQAGEVRIESPAQMYSMVSTVSLEPEPIPLDIKVVLIGDRMLYYMLAAQDPEFGKLFKVEVDFEDDMERRADSSHAYARLIATLARKHGLKNLDATGVARVIDHSARLAGDSHKLTARMGMITDVLREADYWAAATGHKVISAADVQRALDARIERGDRIRQRSHERIQQGTVLIDTAGALVGQINGLAVLSIGSTSFGKPSRITARLHVGSGEVIDIERKSELGGSLHSKGVLILSSYLASHYAHDRPLSLSASLVFEQSYGGVDGDSASSTELYALLSALAEAPIKQSFAVTGSVNQLGRVQAIGGANEKIEGFFDLCQARGLSGEHGVLIPESNVRHLMLRDDVVEACAAECFHIYPIKSIDEGIEILTGVPAGRRGRNGQFPKGTINRRVEDRLIQLAESRRDFAKAAKQNEEKLA